jgi:AraC family transcriptional regulator
MNSVAPLALTSSDLSTEPIPAALTSLIESAVAAFDADRETARRYLQRASALLRVTARPASRPMAAQELHRRGGLAVWQVNRVVDYIEAHLTERITGQALAALISVSVGQLFRAFKASTGIPPFQYVARRRIELACTMMKTTREPLSQVAIACGLCDQSHFCRLFRRLVGVSPGTWRRTHGAEQQPVAAFEHRYGSLNAVRAD